MYSIPLAANMFISRRNHYNLYKPIRFSSVHHSNKLVVQKSSFTDVAVIQLVRIAQAHQWQLTPELKAWIQKACEKNVTSLINEDGFNRQKNKTTMSKTHKGRPQRAFGTLLDEHVADKVHHYVEVKPQPLCISRTPLPSHAFDPPMKNPSIPEMPQIVGKGSHTKTSWYSPGVGELPTEHADHDMVRELDARGKMGKCGNAWLGCFLKQQNRLIVAGGPNHKHWFFGLGEVSDSAALVWPCYVKAQKKHWTYWAPLSCDHQTLSTYPKERPFLIPIVDIKKTYVYCYKWLCPLQIAANHPSDQFMDLGLCPAVMVVTEDKFDTLDRVAAKHAFWDMGLMTLHEVAGHMGMKPPANCNVYGVLHFLVKNILTLNDKQTSDIWMQSMKLPFTTDQDDDFLELDEAFDILDAEEKAECTNHAKKVKTTRATMTEYEESWKGMRDLVMPPAIPQPKAKSRGKAKAQPQPENSYPDIPFGDLKQANMKPLVPPGGNIWKDNAGGWDGHYPPFQRQCYSWSRWGARNSAIYCLRYLWRGWMVTKNKTMEEVPVRGLFDDSKTEQVFTQARASSSTD